MIPVYQWIMWGCSTVIWQGLNSANSRSKNSASALYNFITTISVSAFYLASMILVGNILVQSRSQTKDFVIAVALYSFLSAGGSVVGQQWARRFEKSHHIRHE